MAPKKKSLALKRKGTKGNSKTKENDRVKTNNLKTSELRKSTRQMRARNDTESVVDIVKEKMDEVDSDEEEKRVTKSSGQSDPIIEGADSNDIPAVKKRESDSLKEQFFSGNYLTSRCNKTELCRRLQEVWQTLQNIPNMLHAACELQERPVTPDDLRLLSSEIMKDDLLYTRDGVARSRIACCIVELLRVYAPESPFPSKQHTCTALQFVLDQLIAISRESVSRSTSGGAKSTLEFQFYHILESLSDLKVCILISRMNSANEDEKPTMFVRVAQTFFELIRPDHSNRVHRLMITILVAIIEELESIDQSFLETLLIPLIHDQSTQRNEDVRKESAAESGPYYISRELIYRTSDSLQTFLAQYLNNFLIEDNPKEDCKAFGLRENLFSVIFELHKICPSLLLYIFPNLCMQLQADVIATRLKVVTLLGKLFASPDTEYGAESMRLFREFLGRFRDISQEIRLNMIQLGVLIWQEKRDLAPLIEKECILRLNDSEWEIRRAVVNEVCDLSANHLEIVSEECLRQVGERLKDKKLIIRREAMTGLSQVYAHHVSANWAQSKSKSNQRLLDMIPKDCLSKLGWIPDYVLKCFAYPQQELRLRVVQLLDDFILPKAFDVKTRAKGFLFLYQHLDEVSIEAFRRILQERAKCIQACQEYIDTRNMLRQSKDSSSTSYQNITKSFRDEIAPMFSQTDHLDKLVDQLNSWKDQTVFKALSSISDYTKSQKEIRASRDRLVKCVGSKSVLGVFMKDFCRKSNLLTFNKESIDFFWIIVRSNEGWSTKDRQTALRILASVAKVMPELLYSFVSQELDQFLTADATIEVAGETNEWKIIRGVLEIVASTVKHQKESSDAVKMNDKLTLASSTRKCLEDYCTGNTNVPVAFQQEIAKSSATILANLACDLEEVHLFIHGLCDKHVFLSIQNSKLPSVLSSLHVLLKCSIGYLEDVDRKLLADTWDTIIEYIKVDCTKKIEESTGGKKGKERNGGLTASRLVDIRSSIIQVAAQLLIHNHVGTDGDGYGRERILLDLLFDILRSDGKIWTNTPSLMSRCRLIASTTLLKLMSNARIEALLTVSEWHVLGFVMQDSSTDVRAAFLKKLTAHLMKKSVPHPHKYLSYLALAATESNMSLKKQAKILLSTAIKRMRQMFEAAASQCRSIDDDEIDAIQNKNALIVPEYALPYVIHVLAHHPDFPPRAAVSLSQRSRNGPNRSDIWVNQITYLNFFLDGLVSSSNARDSDNIAFLLQILVKLSACVDVTAPECGNVQELVQSTVEALKKRIRNQSNLKSFPGKIFLPKQLYAPRSKPSETQEMEGAQACATSTSIRNFPRLSTSLSPIKAASFGPYEAVGTPSSSKKRRLTPHTATKRQKIGQKRESHTPSPKSKNKYAGSVTATTPSKRSPLMRRARLSHKSYVAESSDDTDGPDSFVSPGSVAARVRKHSPNLTTQ
uniref:Sister chromatid cohesion protein PDS5 putative n=1 Tax=Albugo laibachii Nc14 TaxID=890382 RepID=F0WCP2_9STRA|nr:sister chromatid cohesion protein PDS5 putative [Albugo laibachii Nc14]CCA24837.1 sister chromatid cohesion protein PDS5 putative [Albugo laibachii Nc14]|eukprot:CCA24837.1 sister chromatid cohesion protein PDS5 putative [Albugo laibachii Nc14]